MARIWLGIIAAFALLTSAQAQTVTGGEIFDAGTYELEVVGTAPAPNTAVGLQSIVRNEKIIDRTTCIPAVLGAKFGFRYRVFGDPFGPYNLRMVTRFPEGGVRNPATNKVHDKSEILQPGPIAGNSSYSGYSFDEDWEIVPGIWVFETWSNDKLIASQKFEVGSCFRGADKQEKYPWLVSG
jgi:hypothetical protein